MGNKDELPRHDELMGLMWSRIVEDPGVCPLCSSVDLHKQKGQEYTDVEQTGLTYLALKMDVFCRCCEGSWVVYFGGRGIAQVNIGNETLD